MLELLWLVPLLPLLGALLNGVVLRGRHRQKRAVAAIACGAVALSCVLGIAVIAAYLGGADHAAGQAVRADALQWMPAGRAGGGRRRARSDFTSRWASCSIRCRR